MKSFFRKMMLVASIMCLAFSASAQIYIGGNIAGAYASSDGGNTSWAIGFYPEVGYRYNDNWAFGGRISYGRSEEHLNSSLVEDSINIKLFTINPYAAYSVLQFNGFDVWAEAGLSLIPEQEGLKSTTIGLYLSPVLTYSLADHFLLKTNLNFAGLSIVASDHGVFSIASSVGGNNVLIFDDDLSIGFVYLF